jgi:hypothetical protein
MSPVSDIISVFWLDEAKSHREGVTLCKESFLDRGIHYVSPRPSDEEMPTTRTTLQIFRRQSEDSGKFCRSSPLRSAVDDVAEQRLLSAVD